MEIVVKGKYKFAKFPGGPDETWRDCSQIGMPGLSCSTYGRLRDIDGKIVPANMGGAGTKPHYHARDGEGRRKRIPPYRLSLYAAGEWKWMAWANVPCERIGGKDGTYKASDWRVLPNASPMAVGGRRKGVSDAGREFPQPDEEPLPNGRKSASADASCVYLYCRRRQMGRGLCQKEHEWSKCRISTPELMGEGWRCLNSLAFAKIRKKPGRRAWEVIPIRWAREPRYMGLYHPSDMRVELGEPLCSQEYVDGKGARVLVLAVTPEQGKEALEEGEISGVEELLPEGWAE